MPNSTSQMIPDMHDWRQIWGSGRPRKGSNGAETDLWHPCRVRRSIVLLKNGSWDPKGRIEAFTTRSPHTNTIVITAEIESGFARVAKDDLVPCSCSPVSSCVAPFQTEALMEGVKGSTRNGRRDPKCPSSRRLCMVQKDTGALVKVLPVTGWRPMKQLAERVHFVRCHGLLDDWSVGAT
ncbi:hypothetical protein TNCV_4385041 [Trichonephila clavipes]|nr:hypothetical protein TNCV_4385041 [Trichonephila clavipes]